MPIDSSDLWRRLTNITALSSKAYFDPWGRANDYKVKFVHTASLPAMHGSAGEPPSGNDSRVLLLCYTDYFSWSGLCRINASSTSFSFERQVIYMPLAYCFCPSSFNETSKENGSPPYTRVLVYQSQWSQISNKHKGTIAQKAIPWHLPRIFLR